TDVVEPGLPPYGAVGVVTESGLRVHRRSSRGMVWRPCPEGCSVDPRFSSPNHPHHGSFGCYPSTSLASNRSVWIVGMSLAIIVRGLRAVVGPRPEEGR